MYKVHKFWLALVVGHFIWLLIDLALPPLAIRESEIHSNTSLDSMEWSMTFLGGIALGGEGILGCGRRREAWKLCFPGRNCSIHRNAPNHPSHPVELPLTDRRGKPNGCDQPGKRRAKGDVSASSLLSTPHSRKNPGYGAGLKGLRNSPNKYVDIKILSMKDCAVHWCDLPGNFQNQLLPQWQNHRQTLSSFCILALCSFPCISV